MQSQLNLEPGDTVRVGIINGLKVRYLIIHAVLSMHETRMAAAL